MRSILNQKARRSDYIHTVGSLNDRDLFRWIASGDEDALAELYQRYHMEIFRFLLFRIHNEAGAEEILQDVFLAAWQRAGTFRGTASVKTWLLRVAYYRAATWIKTQHTNLNLDQVEELPAGAAEMDDRIETAWQSDVVKQALSELSEKHRAALELIFFHELTYREAARVVNCPVGTMKSRVSQALSQVNGLLVKAGMDGT